MSMLADYIMACTDRGECQCGRCADKGDKPNPEGHTADLVFFVVCAKSDPDVETLRRLSKEHNGELGAVDVFDGKEHGYMELGRWLGDQGLALRFMGLASLLGMVDLLTPKNMLPKDTPPEVLMQMAGSGMVSVRAPSLVANVP